MEWIKECTFIDNKNLAAEDKHETMKRHLEELAWRHFMRTDGKIRDIEFNVAQVLQKLQAEQNPDKGDRDSGNEQSDA